MRVKLDEISKFLIICILLFGLFLDNGFYIFIPSLCLLLLLYYLQQPYKPSIYSILAIQHYLAIVGGVFLCNYLGKDINYNTPFRSTVVIASSIGLIALLLPAIYVQNKLPEQSRISLKRSIVSFSVQKVMTAYIVSFFVAAFLGGIAFAFGGFTQIIFWLVNIKWILFLLFGYIAILTGEKKKIFYLFILLEFVVGFYSFFSDFKTVLFFVFVLYLSLVSAVDFKLFFFTVVLGACLVMFALIWTSVKGEYRAFLNGGDRTQKVIVDQDEALTKLYDLSSNTNSDDLENSVTVFLDRLQYTYFFAKTMERVPTIIPFQEGKNWLENIDFVTTPRYLNPDKPILDQTEKTKLYTGLHLAGRDKGTSFSLGYFAECYIDFGLYGMMVLLFIIGCIFAAFYKYLIKKSSKNIVFNYCVGISFFMQFIAFESDGTYLIGRFLSGMLTFYLLVRFVFPPLIDYITIKKDENKF